MLRKLSIMSALLIALLAASCSDDSQYLENEIGSTLKNNGESRISSFQLPHHWQEITPDFSEINLYLTSMQKGERSVYNALARLHDKKVKINFEIPADRQIEDGTYLLQGANVEKHFSARFVVEVENELVCNVRSASVYSNLDGEGTEANPYIIATADDMNFLLYYLNEDDTHGRGLYFTQTADISLEQQHNVANRGFVGESFAGNYKGGGFTISDLYYSGSNNSTDDVNIGLFRTLEDGATVKKLTVKTNSVSGINRNFCILAGSATGNISISDVTVNGSVSQNYTGENIGGIIGCVSNANLTMNNCKVKGGVNYGYINIGGVIGYAENSTLTISNVSTDESQFNVSGTSNIGGIIGAQNNSTLILSEIKLENISDTANPDLYQIHAATSSAGGVIGYCGPLSAASSLSNVYVRCPIGETTAEKVGGIIGHLCNGGQLTLNRCQVAGIVNGKNNVGGLIGLAEGSTTLTIGDLCAVEAQKSAAVGVKGTENIGGFIGYCTMSGGSLNISGTPRMSANVTGQTNTGGVIGSLAYNTLNVADINVDAEVIITGQTNTGGLVGLMTSNALLTSSNSFNFSGSIPPFSNFSPDFSGQVKGSGNTGGAVGRADSSEVKNISVKSNITASGNGTGGVIGYCKSDNYKHIENLTSDCIINGGENTGGIAGKIEGNIQLQDCVNYGTVKAENSQSVGGVVGYAYSPKSSHILYYCVNLGEVSGNSRTGGLCGEIGGDDSIWIDLSYCGNYGKIIGKSSGLGGILGHTGSQRVAIKHSVNKGEIYGNGATYIGGIAGKMGEDADVFDMENNLRIYECGNFGTVGNHSTSASVYIGGIIGYQEEGVCLGENHSYVHDCYNRGAITEVNSNDDAGGIVGHVDYYGRVEQVVNFGTVLNGNGNGGVGDHKGDWYDDNIYVLKGSGDDWKATYFSDSEKGNSGTYDGFDFTNIWQISGGYPILRNCYFQNINRP